MTTEILASDLTDRDWEIRLLFLEEVWDFLADIETELLGISDRGLSREASQKMLRAAHSMKGGAGMMGFKSLSKLAHRLEDFFKILQVDYQQAIAPEVERLLLQAITCLRKVAQIHKNRQVPDQGWLQKHIEPPFQQLHQILGDLSEQHEADLLSSESGLDVRVLMFSTEVDGCLNRLKEVLVDSHTQVLREEFHLVSQELGCLGEMLDLSNFQNLCQEITQALVQDDLDLRLVATSALEMWRRSQALVLAGQFDDLPKYFELIKAINEPLVEENPWQEVNSKSSPEAYVRIPLRQLTHLSDRFGALNSERSSLKGQLQKMQDLAQLLNSRIQKLEQSNLHLREHYDRQYDDRYDRSREKQVPSEAPNPHFDLLELDQYSEFHVLTREIMDSVVQLQEVSSDLTTTITETESIERDLSRASQQMQIAIEQTRMRRLSDILDKFPRLLRELSLDYAKPVQLSIRGGSTLVERSILEKLENPLLHLVRNAFDHGIETPELRVAADKPPQGKIEITAGYRANQMQITISDDGSGINIPKLRDRALQNGFSTAQLDALTEPELLNLIFTSGFSTAAQVTELSGRGVGLDVVRTNLEQIGGTIRIASQQGLGTSFILTIPASLSITRVLLLESNGLQMAIQANSIEEILLQADVTIYEVADQKVIDWQNYTVPLLNLGNFLHFNRTKISSHSENIPIINHPLILIVSYQNIPYGILMDRYWGEQEVSIRNIHSHISLPAGFMGCATIGSGKLLPLMDIDSLIPWLITTTPNCHYPSFPTHKFLSDRRHTIMIVDDSINVRKFLAMTLEKSGYRVEQAKDGLEALEKLRKLNPTNLSHHLSNHLWNGASHRIQAIICDIEMPRLDGFGFLAQAKVDDSARNIPIIMLTSRSGTKHRDLAMRLGASAYFTKPFKEQELLHTLTQYGL
ncbi:MAG: hybrid sensor histidine kinase/response regulator [Pseudanabaenaceae cyanobacterium bins.39]|nr:hybrid sensor histidine kinase/response regulator [Pseudanabaenaceae cyanobacterium bins.39]